MKGYLSWKCVKACEIEVHETADFKLLGFKLAWKRAGQERGRRPTSQCTSFFIRLQCFFIALYLWEGSELGPQDRGVPREHALPLGSWLGLPRGSGVLSDPFHISPADLPELNTHL